MLQRKLGYRRPRWSLSDINLLTFGLSALLLEMLNVIIGCFGREIPRHGYQVPAVEVDSQFVVAGLVECPLWLKRSGASHPLPLPTCE